MKSAQNQFNRFRFASRVFADGMREFNERSAGLRTRLKRNGVSLWNFHARAVPQH